MSKIQLGEIVQRLGNALTGSDVDPGLLVSGVVSLERASHGTITFCRLVDKNAKKVIEQLESCAVIVPDDARELLGDRGSRSYLYARNPRLAFMRVVSSTFPPSRPVAGVHPTAVLADESRIDGSASIGAHCFIGPDVTVGARTIIYPNTTIYGPARIGADVRIFSGTVIGADGFGYERNDDGDLESFPHVGGVVIEDDVEIGANSCVDRGTLNDTEIRSGARIDNLVHISHNVIIGHRAAVIANSMIAGGVTIGDDAWIAPSASVLNQKRLGSNSMVGIGAVVLRDVLDNEVVMGSPAVSRDDHKRRQDAVRSLMSRVETEES